MGALSVGEPVSSEAGASSGGFVIRWMNMCDADSGKELWRTSEWDLSGHVEARIPKAVLKCRAVSREVCFSSRDALEALRLVQTVWLGPHKVETWNFNFGFVIPGSTNCWQNVIARKTVGPQPAADAISGNVVIETTFFDGPRVLNTSKATIYYV